MLAVYAHAIFCRCHLLGPRGRPTISLVRREHPPLRRPCEDHSPAMAYMFFGSSAAARPASGPSSFSVTTFCLIALSIYVPARLLTYLQPPTDFSYSFKGLVLSSPQHYIHFCISPFSCFAVFCSASGARGRERRISLGLLECSAYATNIA